MKDTGIIKKLIIIALVAFSMFICVAAGFGGGVAVGLSGIFSEPGVARTKDQPQEFSAFWQAWNIVHRHFVDRDALEANTLTYGAIRGMIQSLGDEGHTIFLTPEEAEQQASDISGIYSGIGAQLGMDEGLPIIVAPFDGSPAIKAGVKAGDIIIEVDGKDVTTQPMYEIVALIRGEAGTDVTLTLLRPAKGRTLEITITRGEIDAPAVAWAMVPGENVALIRLSQFSDGASKDVADAIKEAKEAGAKALIFDLRNNPGGLLQEAVKVTSQFLTEGNVLQQEDADGKRTAYPVRKGGVAPDIQMVVLVNRGSASSSEILAGAMQDHQRALIVGETTFGTGTVLQPFTLDDGSELLLGTSQWLTSRGRLIRKHGIEPDMPVDLPVDAQALYPSEVKQLTPQEVSQSSDAQLLKALELLENNE